MKNIFTRVMWKTKKEQLKLKWFYSITAITSALILITNLNLARSSEIATPHKEKTAHNIGLATLALMISTCRFNFFPSGEGGGDKIWFFY